jgi:ribulose-5-phosphate 4-epimerase/fuculose-1-phosphate aldolase
VRAAAEDELREEIVALGASLFERRLTFGRSGNLSVRVGDEILVTPTNSSLGTLTADGLARIRVADGAPVERAGLRPSKEAFLHAAVYRARPDARAVVHLHSSNAVAVSCLADVDETNALPPLTAYHVMRVGRLPLLPYVAPGDPALGPIAERAAANAHALLLANHGPVVAGLDLASAADAMEELEATAGLYLALRGLPTRPLTPEQVADLERRVRRA